MKLVMHSLKRTAALILAGAIFLSFSLGTLYMVLSVFGYESASGDSTKNLSDLVLFSRKAENGATGLNYEKVKAMESQSEVAVATSFLHFEPQAFDTYPIILADDAAFSMGIIRMETGDAGFSETGLTEEGTLQIIFCGEEFSASPVGQPYSMRLGVKKQDLAPVGRVPAPYLLPTQKNLFSLDESAGRNIMGDLPYLIVKNTPEVDAYLRQYPGTIIDFGALGFLQLKDGLSDTEKQAFLTELQKTYAVKMGADLLADPVGEKVDKPALLIRAWMLYFVSLLLLCGLCVYAKKKNSAQLCAFRENGGTCRTALAALYAPAFLMAALGTGLLFVWPAAWTALEYWANFSRSSLLRLVIGNLPSDRMLTLPFALILAAAVALLFLMPLGMCFYLSRRVKRGV